MAENAATENNQQQPLDTTNKFLVSSKGSLIHVLNPSKLVVGITQEEAVNLAAWLIAVSMSDIEQFKQVLDGVLNT